MKSVVIADLVCSIRYSLEIGETKTAVMNLNVFEISQGNQYPCFIAHVVIKT